MSVIKISMPNPNDGTTTFNQVKFYEADDADGTNASNINTSAIDTTYRQQIDPGFTTYTYTTGSTSKYYAASYYNSSSAVESDKTDYVLGGKDRWDSMFENEMDDTANAVWAQADIARFKKWALEALYPSLFRQVIDTSLTLDNDSAPSYTYDLPFGIFNVSEVAVGDIDNSTSTFKVIRPDKWSIENGKLHFYSIPASESSATIRLIASKKYLEVGEVPERYDRIAMHHMKMSAYMNMSEDFPRFKTWAQLQEGTKVSFENLRVQAREFERKFRVELAEVADNLYPTLL